MADYDYKKVVKLKRTHQVAWDAPRDAAMSWRSGGAGKRAGRARGRAQAAAAAAASLSPPPQSPRLTMMTPHRRRHCLLVTVGGTLETKETILSLR